MSDRDPALPRVRYRTPLRRKVIMGGIFILFALNVALYGLAVLATL